MRYSRLELSIIGIGAAAVLTSLLFTFKAQPVAEEIVAQLLLLVVLVAAVHWGRNGGFVAAVLASLVYILLRVPLVVEEQGLSGDVAILISTRVLAYGVIGIVGGELCRRLKYFIARVERSDSLDEWSQLYNERHISRSLESVDGQFRRYGMAYSVVLLELSEGLTAELRPSRHRMLVRGVANHVRNDTRLVDEVARLDDGRFLVILPHTGAAGAAVVRERLSAGVADTLGAKSSSVSVTSLSAPEDGEALSGLVEDLRISRIAYEGSGS